MEEEKLDPNNKQEKYKNILKLSEENNLNESNTSVSKYKSEQLQSPDKGLLDKNNIKNFWEPTTSWDERKTIALRMLNEKKHDESMKIYYLAYIGSYELISDMYDNYKAKSNLNLNQINQNQSQKEKRLDFNSKVSPYSPDDPIYQKDSLGLTPFIYSIWGEIDRRDQLKNTSKTLLDIITKENNQHQKVDYLNQIFIENELGHLLLHKLESTDLNFEINHLIEKDLYESASYYIEVEGFKDAFLNSYVKNSIVFIAIKNKSYRCLNLFFNLLLSNNNSYLDSKEILDVIEKEISFYIGYNSPEIVKLLSKLVNTEEKSMIVNPYFIPKFKIIKRSDLDLENIENGYFDDEMPCRNTMIRVKILKFKIKLPVKTLDFKSWNLIKSIISTENYGILKTDIIKYYIQYRWDKLWIWILFKSISLL